MAARLQARHVRGGPTAGFLLTETLATFTISAFVLLGLVSAASVLLRAVDGSVARIEHVDDLGRAMEALRRDVASIARARWNGTEPQPFVFRGGPNSLYFAQSVQTPDGGRTLEAVALREIVVDGRPTLARSAARLPARAASFADLTFGPAHEVWTGVARLRFSYIPPRTGILEPPPLTTWPTGTRLPAAVVVEAVDRETRRVLVSTHVTIEANADIGCLDAGTAAGAASPPQQADPEGKGARGTTASSDDGFCSRGDAAAKPNPPAPPAPTAGPTL